MLVERSAAITALRLRQVIESVIGDFIGTYAFSRNQKSKAIAVIKGGDIYPPPNTVATGLEVVIFYPSLKVEALLGGYVVEDEWIIHLKQWDSKENTLNPTRLLLSVLNGVKNVSKMSANEKLGIPETMQIRLREFSYEGIEQ